MMGYRIGTGWARRCIVAMGAKPLFVSKYRPGGRVWHWWRSFRRRLERKFDKNNRQNYIAKLVQMAHLLIVIALYTTHIGNTVGNPETPK
jgi:hypothetical protein